MYEAHLSADPTAQSRALWLSTLAFTVCFAAWTIFSILGVQIRDELALSEFAFGLLVGAPILTGSLSRLVLGVWADQHGRRVIFAIVMVTAALATALLALADDYTTFLLAALGVGIAGGSFAVGVAYVSKWHPNGRQGTALGIFGAGNVGAAVTKFLAPIVMVAMGWKAVALIWAAALLVMAVAFLLFTKDEPDLAARKASGTRPESFAAMMQPLATMQVWRFSLYYFLVFGGFVALALWLPRYVVDAYGVDIATAGVIGAAYSVPASIFRAYGGVLSDRHGARRVMYVTLGVSALVALLLSGPPTGSAGEGIGIAPFILLVFTLGFAMSLGKAAVYKHIAVYHPHRVGAVGGLVGLIGGIGGFALPVAFGLLNDLTGNRQSCFLLIAAVSLLSLLWMHAAVLRREGAVRGAIAWRNPWVIVACLLAVLAPWPTVLGALPASGGDLLAEAPFWQMIAVAAGGFCLMRLARLPRPVMQRDGRTGPGGSMAAPRAGVAE